MALIYVSSCSHVAREDIASNFDKLEAIRMPVAKIDNYKMRRAPTIQSNWNEDGAEVIKVGIVLPEVVDGSQVVEDYLIKMG